MNRSASAGQRTSNVHAALLRWYRRNARDFPCRRTRDPYRILISEIMLQQTQASRVLQKYPPFLRRFPTLRFLARAKRSSVIRAWQGMGYNNRAIRLHSLAQQVAKSNRGRLPDTVEELRQLPGIGKYTSHAIACFAHGRQVPVVDTNVRRVLSRLFPKLSRQTDAWEVAETVLPRRRAFEWNQALFDLGSSFCTARSPRCEPCPLRNLCPSAHRVPTTPSRIKRERGRDGIPNRIYRGRIVEALRNTSRSSMSAERMGRTIKSNYTPKDRGWLVGVLEGLERDGVVKLRNGSTRMQVALAE
jgi:A/G-specific adenine glycosylase